MNSIPSVKVQLNENCKLPCKYRRCLSGFAGYYSIRLLWCFPCTGVVPAPNFVVFVPTLFFCTGVKCFVFSSRQAVQSGYGNRQVKGASDSLYVVREYVVYIVYIYVAKLITLQPSGLYSNAVGIVFLRPPPPQRWVAGPFVSMSLRWSVQSTHTNGIRTDANGLRFDPSAISV